MALSFAFGGNTGQSYEDLKRKRQFAESMMLRGMGSQPKTAMEGLNSAASSIFGALIAKKAGAQEAAGQEAYNKRRESAFSGLIGQPPGGAPASQPPIAAPDPNSPSVIGDEAMSVLGKPSNNYKPGDRESFVSAMMPHALEASKMTGVDPRLIVAQAAQETGWGAHAPGNNYFGVKSHGQGGGNNLSTTEYVNGQPVTMNDNFRSYGGMRDSAMGYANFLLENPRYQPMMNAQGLDAQLAALGQSGYATDPNYASSVGSIAKSLPDLMALASDPYASDADRSVFAGLIQQALTPPDPMKGIELQKAQLELAQMQNPQAVEAETFTGPDGTVYSFDPVTREAKPLTGAKLPDEGYRMLMPDEASARGLAPGKAYQIGPDDKVYEVGGGGANVTVNNGGNGNKFLEESDKAAAARIDGYITAGAAATQMIGDIQALSDLAPHIGTGKGAQVMATLGPYAEALGVDINGLDEAQSFKSIVDRLAPQMRPAGSGSSSDFDARQFLNSLPKIGNSPGGNEIIIETLSAIQKHKIEAANIAQLSLLPPEQGGITWQESEKRIRALGNPYAAFNSFSKKLKSTDQPVRIQGDPEYDALPSGTVFIGPDGVTRRKP